MKRSTVAWITLIVLLSILLVVVSVKLSEFFEQSPKMCQHENVKEIYCSPEGVTPYTKRVCEDCGYYLGYTIHGKE